jgi:hypothetical protein
VPPSPRSFGEHDVCGRERGQEAADDHDGSRDETPKTECPDAIGSIPKLHRVWCKPLDAVCLLEEYVVVEETRGSRFMKPVDVAGSNSSLSPRPSSSEVSALASGLLAVGPGARWLFSSSR